jgi:hypothetical protein
MLKKIKNTIKAIRKWDKKNTTFSSSTYMLIFVTSSVVYVQVLKQAISSL